MISVEEYRLAFEEILPNINEKKFHILAELLHAPEHSLSGPSLITKLKYEDPIIANSLMGQIGRAIYKFIGKHPDNLLDGEFQPWTVIAQAGRDRGNGFSWQLRPNVVVALLSSGFFKALRNPEELTESESQTFAEGAVQVRYVNAYERSSHARDHCLRTYGYSCSCCEQNMAEVYGLELDFVHVHHLNPLAARKEEYMVDPEKDLRPVCPNCHAIIHLVSPIRTIDEVRRMLGKPALTH